MAGIRLAGEFHMIALLRLALQALAARLVQRRLDVQLGTGTRVRWTSLLGQRVGRLRVGQSSIVNCRIDFDGPDGEVRIGDRCFIGASHLVCRERITLGDDVIISWGVTVVDHNSHALDWEHRRNDVADWARGKKDWRYVDIRPVEIHDKVWIGFGATLLKGVVIGEGAVIGAGSIVTRDVPAHTVVVGNPAQPVKRINENARHAD
jgi:acetyltransferase-like isoleucine patch superfamily enzyme